MLKSHHHWQKRNHRTQAFCLIERDPSANLLLTQSQAMAKMPIAVTECRLLRSSAGRDTNNHLRAAVQLDILLGAEQNAGSLSHPGILLARRIVCQQHAG